MIFSRLDDERAAGAGTESNQCERRDVPGRLSEYVMHSVPIMGSYHPIIVIGCATAKRIFFPMFKSSARFDIRAMTSWTAFTAINLYLWRQFVVPHLRDLKSNIPKVRRTILDLQFQAHAPPLVRGGCRPSNVRLEHIWKRPMPWDQTSLLLKERQCLRATKY